jgi:hypothetical protein
MTHPAAVSGRHDDEPPPRGTSSRPNVDPETEQPEQDDPGDDGQNADEQAGLRL